jgi:hypothetical protein
MAFAAKIYDRKNGITSPEVNFNVIPEPGQTIEVRNFPSWQQNAELTLSGDQLQYRVDHIHHVMGTDHRTHEILVICDPEPIPNPEEDGTR